jgi:hypothetical protein
MADIDIPIGARYVWFSVPRKNIVRIMSHSQDATILSNSRRQSLRTNASHRQTTMIHFYCGRMYCETLVGERKTGQYQHLPSRG